MLILHHSNSLSQLSQILLHQLAEPVASVLKPELILVQNPGMKRWLQEQISQTLKVAANLEFPLPSRFIWDVFLSQFDDITDLSVYDAQILRWRIMQLLNRSSTDRALSVLNTYLRQDDQALKRFQLAEKLANLFDQYLVYRPDMIRAWEQGSSVETDVEAWQSHLWRLLRQQDPQPHRTELIGRLLQQLHNNPKNLQNLPKRIFIFALSAMSPQYMKVLQALGLHLEVHIFILNPCRHYWGDIRSKKEQIKLQHSVVIDNELLASLGKQGRDYIDQFYDDLEPPLENHQFIDITPDSLLKRVQFDILNLESETVAQTYHQDDSLQVVSCYSELRELQVLHDGLLQRFNDHPEWHPHDIVVMSPNIEKLAPYIEAVFGMQPDHKKIPYSISDHNELASLPLMQAIVAWIGLGSSRFSASEIITWLELPALQRAYALEEQDLEVIRYWINDTQVRWGMDQAHRSSIGAGDNNLNTWKQGINRLLSAFVALDTDDMLEDYPAASVLLSSSEYQILGQLQRFLDDLSHWSKRLQTAYDLSDWQILINDLIETFLHPDEDEEWLLKNIRDQLSAYQVQSEQADFKEKLDAVLIAQLLQNDLQQGASHHQYLTGAVNFCNLIPMRSLPFKVVCLIGMSDEHFPRKENASQIDLIERFPKKGDRSRREDDRYMFLQALLSAQDHLYISYVGQNRKDDSDIEPSVVISELLDQVESSTGINIPIERTSLQPFSLDNYIRGSYSELWQIQNAITPTPFLQPITAISPSDKLELDELLRFFSNPPRYFMERRLNISLQGSRQDIMDEEAFILEPLKRFQINHEMIEDLFQFGHINNKKYLNSGVLGQDNVGILHLTEQQQKAEDLFQSISQHEHFSHACVLEANLSIEGRHLQGHIHSYSNQGLLQFSLSTKKGKTLFPMWVKHCLLCATEQIQFSEILFPQDQVVFTLLSPEEALKQVGQFMALFDQGLNECLPIYMDTAYEYFQNKTNGDMDQAKEKVKELWNPDRYQPFFEAQDPYILTSQKNDAEWPEDFYQLADTLWSPVFTAMGI